MVVVIADPILVPSRRAGGLDAPDQAGDEQDAKGVVHRLERDRPDLSPRDVGHSISGDMRLTGDGAQYRQSLGRHLNTVSAKKIGRVRSHRRPA
jgi:hypothetical protein